MAIDFETAMISSAGKPRTHQAVGESPRQRGRGRLVFASLVLLLAVTGFAAIARNVMTGASLSVLDVHVAQWLHQRATPHLTSWMMAVTTLNSTLAVSIYGAAIAFYQGWHRRWRCVATIIACVGGGLLLNDLLKHAFHRGRPLLDHPLLTLETTSFPSGHVAGSTVFYGLLVVWIFGRTQQWRWRLSAAAIAAAAIALVAFSRVYLGVHFLSDVVAAFAEGVGWLALCLGALAAVWPHGDVGKPGSVAKAAP